MLFIAVGIAVALAILIQKAVYTKHGFDGIEYTAGFSSDEVCVGDDIYLFEEIVNDGPLPVTYIKIDTELPEGLEFTLLESEKVKIAERGSRGHVIGITQAELKKRKKPGIKKETSVRTIQSVFFLRPYSKIRRRWRVRCRVRGDYVLNGVLVTSSDILGFDRFSKLVGIADSKKKHLTVLPRPEALDGRFASSRFICGDAISNLCPVTDPLRIVGSREYSTSDPMNRINWKSTAVHACLMSNLEEKTVRHRFSVMVNMNSREIELNPKVPGYPGNVEKCVTVACSILDRIAAEDVPVKLFANCVTDNMEGAVPVNDDETGSKIAVLGTYSGKKEMIYALRALAKIKMEISVPAEKMFDHAAANPSLYCENENLIIVSSYLDGRLMNLKDALEPYGVHIVYYIVTPRNDIINIPPDADVYFSLI